MNSETRQNPNGTRTRTCGKGADDCCTDEATRRRETYRDKDGEKEKEEARHKNKKSTKENRTQGVDIKTKLPGSATKAELL